MFVGQIHLNNNHSIGSGWKVKVEPTAAVLHTSSLIHVWEMLSSAIEIGKDNIWFLFGS